MLNIMISTVKRSARESFLGFPYENHLKTLKIDMFMESWVGSNDILAPFFVLEGGGSPPDPHPLTVPLIVSGITCISP